MIKPKKIDFIFPENMGHCVHDVISLWLSELDKELDEKIKLDTKKKILEIEQVINRTGKPNIHFHDSKHKYEMVKYV